MSDWLLQYGLSNLPVALALGLLAWAVQTFGRRPMLAHLLWVVVLLKLLTPPLFRLPIIAADGIGVMDPAAASTALSAAAATVSMTPLVNWPTAFVTLWLAGSALMLFWSCARIVRFGRLLTLSSKRAGDELQNLTSSIAHDYSLKSQPPVYTTGANISPMVWWTGGRARVYLPSTLLSEMDAGELRLVLAHELGHLCRSDHIVRWLEWLVCIAFWWNPIAWWARRNLRINEEVCCDALVLATLKPDRKRYASSLVTALEVLTRPIVRPPVVASEMNGGGFMERRLKMIVSTKRLALMPRWLKHSVLAAAAISLPLGFGLAQETGDYERVSRWLEAGVNAAELTEEQAEIMLRALRATESGQNIVHLSPATVAKREAVSAALAARLEQAVARGEITEEEARLQIEEFQVGGTVVLKPQLQPFDPEQLKPVQ